jgi:apolipoprotein N-acyltransferase
MSRRLPLLLLLLAGCSKGPQADLQYIGEARSIAGEWALVNEQAADGKLTGPYIATMHKSLRQQIETAKAALTVPDSAYAHEMATLVATPDNAPPQELRHHADRLKQIEDSLESA